MVGVAHREMEVVQHHDDRLAAVGRYRRQHVERGDLVDEIEMRRRLVEQHELGVLRDDRGQRDPAALAAGQRAHVAAASKSGEAEARERRARASDSAAFPTA